jgi:cytoskeletal protein CcmA (bactofilin family)
MALFGRSSGDGSGTQQQGTVSPPAREVEMFERERDAVSTLEANATSAFLGKGSRVTGKLVCEGSGRIEGQVEGEIAAQDTLIIGESAVVNAQIKCVSIVVQGRVTGDITAAKRIEIRAPGKVFGNIATPSLVIHEGTTFKGQCSMGEAEAGKTTPKIAPIKDERPEEPQKVRAEAGK